MTIASWDQIGQIVIGPHAPESFKPGGFIPAPPSREEVEAMVRRIVREELARAGVEVAP